jgi:hypothetical protein
MSRLWLAALGAAAVIACGDDNNDPNNLFPDVAGTYDIEGEFDGIDPNDASFIGTMTIEQESLESSLLTGTANITVTTTTIGSFPVTNAELLDASVDLAGQVVFQLRDEAQDVTWDFQGERGGDIIDGDHTVTQGDATLTGTWTADRR